MKHVKLFRSFLYESLSPDDIKKIAERELSSKPVAGRPAWTHLPNNWEVTLNKTGAPKLHKDLKEVWLVLKLSGDKCIANVNFTTHYQKTISSKELNVFNELVAELKNCYISLCNGASEAEVVKTLKEKGWYEHTYKKK